MENKPVVRTEPRPTLLHHPRFWLMRRLFVVIAVVVVATLGYLVFLRFASTTSDSKAEKVLTITDLDNPDVKLDVETSDASVENLTKELETKIDKQIAAKENPFDTVYQLAGVLASTTNKTRQNQLTSFLENFLSKHEETLQYATESGEPEQAQINYWKGKLYAKLVYNYQFMEQNKFKGSDGRLIDTTKEQLKYIDLYLALANDPASHPPIPEADNGVIVGYIYNEMSDFLELKNDLAQGGTTQ